MISEEITTGHSAFAQVACSDSDYYKVVKNLFRNTQLFITISSDITGITWSVILKNVYAMIFGITDELQLGDNMRGYLTVNALNELDQIVRHMGGQSGSSYNMAGLGDLITTATSEDSHHHELGRKIARGEVNGLSGEGIHTLAMVVQHKLFDYTDYSLFNLIHSVIKNPCDVRKQIDDYLLNNFKNTQLLNYTNASQIK